MQTKPIKVSNEKYIWQYKVSLFRNPTIFLNTAKAILIAIGITILLKLALIILGIFAVLLVLGYLLYAAIMGGYYIVDFGMDENKIVHTQNAKQAKKADDISTAAIIMGLLAKNRGAVSAGLMSSGRTTSRTDFTDVKKVIVDKKGSVIKLWYFGWNEVYADGDDFDFVANWIRAHVPETAEWIVK